MSQKKHNTPKNKVSFWLIFWVIFKITIISFGGGNAIFPIIKNQMVDKYKWITENELDDIIIVTNSIPGASVVESLSYIAIKLLDSKWKGILVCFIGLLPHIFVFFAIYLLSISFFPIEYLYIIYVAVIPIIVAMLLKLTYRYFKSFQTELNWPAFLSFLVASTAFSFFIPTPFNIPIIFVCAVIIIGIFFEIWKKYWFKKHPPISMAIPVFKQSSWTKSPVYKKLWKQSKHDKPSLVWLEQLFTHLDVKDINVKYKIIFINDSIYFRPKWGYTFKEATHD